MLYRKRTDNLLQYKSIPAESDTPHILTNFGSIENKGIEAEVAATMMRHAGNSPGIYH